MVQEIHRLTNIGQKDFHRHYNLKPWYDEAHRDHLEQLASRYRNIFPTDLGNT
jgi:hypothetical protein